MVMIMIRTSKVDSQPYKLLTQPVSNVRARGKKSANSSKSKQTRKSKTGGRGVQISTPVPSKTTTEKIAYTCKIGLFRFSGFFISSKNSVCYE